MPATGLMIRLYCLLCYRIQLLLVSICSNARSIFYRKQSKNISCVFSCFHKKFAACVQIEVPIICLKCSNTYVS